MHSSIFISALFAVGVLGTPVHQKFHHKKDVVVEVVNTIIDVVTETVGGDAQATPPPAYTPPAAVQYYAPPTTSTASSTSAPPASTSSSTQSSSGAGNGALPESLSSDSQQYQDIILAHHNVHRANHSAQALTWNNTLAQYAKEQAQTCVYTETLPAGQPGGWGQNIAAGASVENVSSVITEQFYNSELPEYPGFNNNNPDMSKFQDWGHFSQLVWADTTSVGCYSYVCNPTNACQSNGQPYLAGTSCGNGGVPAINHVCNYYPPGNYAGDYEKVGSPGAINAKVSVCGTGVVGLPSGY